MNLRARWYEIAKPGQGDWTWGILWACYCNTGRHYHNLEHVHACLTLLDRLMKEVPLVNGRMAGLALWWHDAVYVPGLKSNEEQSAEFMTGIHSALAVDLRELLYARRCILATKHADAWQYVGNPTIDAVVDIDLSILGSAPSTYKDYARAIRLEFGHVPDEAWRAGRSEFLNGMLARSRIYLTDPMVDWYEQGARTNMRAELAGLLATEAR